MKKLLTVFLILCLVLPASAVVFADAQAATDDMLALASLGVFDDTALSDASANVTRGSFAKIAVKFANAPETLSVPSYKDIDGDAALYAATAVKVGLMDDGITGNFRAEREITGHDVVKAAVVSLGYTDIAKYFGDYDMAARKLGVLKGISLNSPVTYGELAEYLAEILRTEKTYTVINKGNIDIKKTGVSYIEDVFDCRILSARVTANAQTSLDGSAGMGEGFVKLGGEKFNTDIDLGAYIGCTAEFIVKDADHRHTVIHIFTDSIDGKEALTLSADDIDGYSGNTYTYYVKNTKKKATLSAKRTVVHNGQVTNNYNASTLVPSNGYVTLVDGNGDGTYDIAFVYSYKIVVTAKPDLSNKMLADKFGDGTVTWDDDTIMDITRDGKSTDISSIKSGDVLTVYRSADGKTLKINAYSKNVKGEVVSFDVNKKEITIGEETYKIDVDYFAAHTDKYRYTEGGTSYDNNVYIGKRVVAYPTADGKIAYMEYTSSSLETGYLIDAKIFTQSMLNPTLGFKIFTANGKIENFSAAGDKVVIDNERVSRERAIEMLSKGTGEVMSQLVRYSLDADGNVTEIDTPYNNEPLSSNSTPLLERHSGSEETDGGFRITYSSYLGTNSETQLFKDSSVATFGRQIKVTLSANCAAFTVPSNPKEADEGYFAYYTRPKDYYKSDSYYKVESYQFDDSSFSADVVLTIDESGAQSSSIQQQNVRVITKMTTVAGDRGDAKKLEVTGNNYTSGTIYATEDKFWKNVKPSDPDDKNTYELGEGDIIWYDLNNKNEITNIYIVYDASESDPDKAFKASSRADMRRQHGDIYTYPRMILHDVYEIKGKTAKVTTENLHTYTGDASILQYDLEDLSIYGDTIIHIDKTGPKIKITSSGNYQGSTNIDDIKDYVTYGNHCSRIIGVTKWGFAECLFLIDDIGDIE